jgi:hypothetical protein
MRIRYTAATLCFGILWAVPSPALIVDRIAIAAGTKVITDSEIQLRIRLTALQNNALPDFSLESRKRAAQLLIDQRIVEREMDVGHYPRLSGDARKGLLAKFSADQQRLRQSLREYGLTADDLEEDLARQADLLTFLSLRFRPAAETLSDERADSELNAWLRDQRKRTRIEYLEKELAP